MNVIDRKATMELINRLIDEKGISRMDIAKWLNLKPQAVYGWQYGKFPTANNLFNLATILEVSVMDIVVLDQNKLKELSQTASI